jgi:hypothetical protein
MFVLARGSGSVRCRFESDPSDVDEPSGMNFSNQRDGGNDIKLGP